MKIVVKIIFAILALIALYKSLTFLYVGKANILTSIIIYSFIFWSIHFLIGKIFTKWRTSNWMITYWAIFCSVLILELGLRYITKSHLSYSEANGRFNYQCPYDQIKGRNLNALNQRGDVRLMIGPPSDSVFKSNQEFSYLHTYNSLGLREKEISQVQIDTSFVVMAIGDSFAEGFGTPADSTWINLLAKRLKEDIPNLLPVNAGISGSDIVFESYKLRHLLHDAYQPDLVILTINESDIQDIIVRGGKERFISAQKLRYNSGPTWKYLYSFSHVFRLIIHRFFKVRWHFYTDKGYEAIFKKTKDIILKSITEDLLPFSEEKEFDVLVVFTPMELELRKQTFRLTEIYDELVKIDSSLTLNMYDAFLKTPESDYQHYYWPIDLHCNSKGYLKWAEEMKKHLKTTDKSY